jgi:hypothetical protein
MKTIHLVVRRIKMSKEIDSGINMYAFNRANMGKLPILTKKGLEGAKQVVVNFVNEKLAQYYMLLNHDNRYFTLFNFNSNVTNDAKVSLMGNDVVECMQNCNFGIIDISKDESGDALEVWVKDLETEVVYMYLLFPYDFGVIEY